MTTFPTLKVEPSILETNAEAMVEVEYVFLRGYEDRNDPAAGHELEIVGVYVCLSHEERVNIYPVLTFHSLNRIREQILEREGVTP